MSVYHELIRLGTRYTAALTDPYSCPRDRVILLAKITDLQEEAARLKVRAAKALEANEAEIERMKKTLKNLRAGFKQEPLPVEAGGVEQYLEAWQQEQGEKESDHIRLWEAERQY